MFDHSMHRLLRASALVPVALLATAFNPAPAEMNTASAAAQIAPPAIAPVEARWSVASARDLLKVIRAAGDEGLNPADYAPDAVEAAIAAGPSADLDAAADASGMAVARDFLLGRVQDKARFDWHIERSPYEAYALNAGLAQAASAGTLTSYLRGLLPNGEEYRALKAALADARDPAQVALIRANLERWRWMPRDLGSDYLFVNVPTYSLDVVRGGQVDAQYDVVVGAPKTPTPALAVAAESVVVNPWWTLPPSVLSEGGSYPASRGFVTRRAASGQMIVQQKPGPMNALGRIKINMPNAHAIYLHDTPAKAAFRRADRALSHGCIRVKDIDRLAADLQDDNAVVTALDGSETTNLRIAAPVPVYIVYMTVAVENGQVRPLKDIYQRDNALLAALDRGTSLAARGGATRAR